MGETLSSDRTGHLVQIGLTVLKNAILINGTACIALLTLVGHAASSGSSTLSASMFGFPLALFATGVFLAACASGTAYLGEGLGFRQEGGGMICSLVTVGLVVISLVLFLFGAWETYDALRRATG
jgi:hypothetical protein